MLNSLYTATLGMQAQKMQLDVVSNNLANANTAGYKSERVDFSAVLDQQAATEGAFVNQAPDGKAAADAAMLGTIWRDFSQGPLRATDSTLDIAVNGAGFIEIQLDDRRSAYVRGGRLAINADGYLTAADGHLIKTDIRIPAGATEIQIDKHGVLAARVNGDQVATALGRIPLASFANPDTLKYLGGGIYEPTAVTSEPARGDAGEDGLGEIAAGKLENSNVKLVDEMVSLMLTQRVYELNSKVIQAADELMGLTNNIRKG